MKKITRDMLRIYKPISNLDWMNYTIVRKQDMTAHHIIKRENGGKLEQSNIALLLPPAHQYLHLIEYKEKEIYEIINKMFRVINDQKHEPTTEQRQLIESMLLEFESLHRWDKTSKNTLLLKRKYTERGTF